jgi:molybdopterin-guanine dinucleotide biosynthesis protein MobB
MTDPRGFLGVVLAGGASSRFGTDKALVRLDGERLLDRAVSVLRRVCPEIVVASSHPEHEGAGWTRLPDLRPGKGPLAGIETALVHAERAGAAGIVVLACDVSGAEPELFRSLMDELGDAAAIAPFRDGPPGFEPLCAVYRTVCAGVASRLLDDDELGTHRLFDSVGGRVLRDPVPALANVNTREDLARLGDTSGGDPTVVCIVGKKKSGKTTTVVGLVAELARRGHEVMTVKHGHGFDLDREGSDSWKHRHLGGATRVVVAGPEEFAVMGRWSRDDEPGELPLETLVRRYLADADIVIAEGFKASDFPRIEVFRTATHETPVYGSDQGGTASGYLAVLTDDQRFEAECPVWDVDDPGRFAKLADVVETLHRERGAARTC